MWIRASSRRSAASALIALSLSGVLASAQTTESSQGDVQAEITQMRNENGAIREQLSRLEEQQKALLQLVDALQRRLDGQPAPVAYQPPTPVPPTTPPKANTDPLPQAQAQPPAPSRPAASTPAAADRDVVQAVDPYQDSIVLLKTTDDSRVPLLLRLWDVTQLRYTNTQLGNQNYTDHLGASRQVVTRNDFSLNRNLLQFVGYIFDKRLQFNLITWASNSSAAIVEGGYISWNFNKAITIYSGYWGAPGTRSLTGTFPYFVQLDRSMADQFFRPGFTQGAWVDGEPWKGFHYEFFVGDGLNTLTIPTTKIDRHLVYSGSVWWEPFGTYGIPGRARGMYDDYQGNKKPRIRVGTSYTHSRENRFSNFIDEATNPENAALFNSDGVNTFATGAFAPGVTVSDATYRMLSADAGVKRGGWAVNTEYFFRWLDRFTADGPLPIHSTFDHGFELEVSKFIVPRRWEVYGRTSWIFGQFNTSYEWAPGIKYYLVPNHRVWLVAEGLRIVKSPVSSIITPYNSGFTGWAPLLQWMFNF